MKYMINICYGDINKRKASFHAEDNKFIMNKYAEWSQKMGKKIHFAHKLKDGEGRRLDLHNSEITDGPFVETKETIGGFYIVEAESYTEACQMAKECPTLIYQGGYVEVRLVEM